MALRAIQCLCVVSGQWRHVGGGIAVGSSRGQVNMACLERADMGPPAPRSINMIQLGRALTDPDLAPPIRALYVWNSNPAVIAGDQTRVLQGLARTDLFTVVHEQFMTDTARYADIVLPGDDDARRAGPGELVGLQLPRAGRATPATGGRSQEQYRSSPTACRSPGLRRRAVPDE